MRVVLAGLLTLGLLLKIGPGFTRADATEPSREGGETVTALSVRTVLDGHAEPVRYVTFSPDGKMIASASVDGTIKLWDAETGKQRTTLKGHTDWVFCVAFSPDGKTAASASRDDTIKFWDLQQGLPTATLNDHGDEVFCVVYSPDGKTLASSSLDYAIKLWDVETREARATLKAHTNAVRWLARSPDGKTFASSSYDGTIRLWNFGDGELMGTMRGHQGSVKCITFSADGNMLASGSTDTTIKLWNVQEQSELKTLSGHSEDVRSVAFLPDGKTLASSSYDETIKLWDLETGEVRATYDGQTCFSLAFSPDGKTLASADQNGTVKLWNLVRKKQQSSQQPKTSASPREQYEALVKEVDDANRKFQVEYRQAKTAKERRELMQRLYPRPQTYAARFMQLASDYPNDPAAVDALVWIVSRARYGHESDRAMQILTRDHMESSKLVRVVQSLMYNSSPAAQKLLRSALEKSPHHEVKGWACYCLAKALIRSQRGQPRSKDDPPGEAEQLLQRVVEQFATVKGYRGTLADLASGGLFELRHLSIGCVAPDIEGEDIDGVAFKLSDYRGTVVVLDFWGNW